MSPNVAVYGASKAFNNAFALELTDELGDKMDVVAYRPSVVESNMSKQKASRFSVISSEEASRTLLDKLGQDHSTSGSWKHALEQRIGQAVVNLIPVASRCKLIADEVLKFKKKRDG